MAAPRDLVTMLYKPRETMRRVLDDTQHRWWIQIVVLAFICISFGDPDIRRLPLELPDLALGPLLAFVALILIVTAVCWVLGVYAIAWLVKIAAHYLDGHGSARDVREALAWALVPMIWSIVYRIPSAIYRSRLQISSTNPWQITVDVLQQGAVSVALIIIAIKLVFDIWVVWLASVNVAEALRFETWKGFTALAIVAVVPIVVTTAAILAFHH